MTSRDWEKELAKIDKQLASLPDEELDAEAPVGTGMPRGVAAAPARAKAPVGAAANSSAVVGGGLSRKTRIWAYTKLGVAVAGAVGVWFWPWAARCGLPLAGLVSAGVGVGLLGVWSGTGTWKHRLGRAHLLSLLVVVSGAVLVAREVLPRVGYAYGTFDRPERWSCQAAPPASPAPSVPTPQGPGTGADASAPASAGGSGGTRATL